MFVHAEEKECYQNGYLTFPLFFKTIFYAYKIQALTILNLALNRKVNLDKFKAQNFFGKGNVGSFIVLFFRSSFSMYAIYNQQQLLSSNKVCI